MQALLSAMLLTPAVACCWSCVAEADAATQMYCLNECSTGHITTCHLAQTLLEPAARRVGCKL